MISTAEIFIHVLKRDYTFERVKKLYTLPQKCKHFLKGIHSDPDREGKFPRHISTEIPKIIPSSAANRAP